MAQMDATKEMVSSGSACGMTWLTDAMDMTSKSHVWYPIISLKNVINKVHYDCNSFSNKLTWIT